MGVQEDRLPVIFLMGPTCGGKTALAVELARAYPVSIINVDSALFYRGLDIGAARPSPAVLAEVPHRLLGIRDPAEPYSVADFCQDAMQEIQAIHRENRLPLLVGGTMLYFRALMQGLSSLPPADASVRMRLEREAEELGWEALHNRLKQQDPEAAARISPRDRQRLQRALEVYELTAVPLSQHHQGGDEQGKLLDRAASPFAGFPYTVFPLAVAPVRRELLHQRIEQRFLQMLDAGLVEEVAALRARGDLHPGLPAMKAVGYRQVWRYLDGCYGREEMVYRAIVATRQLAKRQFTWLRRWPELLWLDTDSPGLVGQASACIEPAMNWVLSKQPEPTGLLLPGGAGDDCE